MPNKSIADALTDTFAQKLYKYAATAILSGLMTLAVEHGWLSASAAAELVMTIGRLLGIS